MRKNNFSECYLGIELGSTRIKAVLIDSNAKPLASGSWDWENHLEDGIWTYPISAVEEGLCGVYASIKADIKAKFGVVPKRFKALGISAMMHGYIPTDKEGNLLSSFRTWRNNNTMKESAELSSLFSYPIPPRWTVSHLLKDIKDSRSYVNSIAHIDTLASYVHHRLTGEHTIGLDDASGMFAICDDGHSFDIERAKIFDKIYVEGKYDWKLTEILPIPLPAGKIAGYLTEEGARLLDADGDLEAGIPLCPPEGDAGTGMVATCSVAPRTGNVSAGTSVFASIVLEKPLTKVHPEVDLVTTPDGRFVAMAHSNNCTTSYDGWLSLFGDVLSRLKVDVSKAELYDAVLSSALEGDEDCGGILSYCYVSGEHMTGFEEGRPLCARKPDGNFTLSNFMKSELYSCLCAMRVGLDILFDEEGVKLDVISGHGGFFKTELVGQKIMAAAAKTACKVTSGADEGGAWGIAILASYLDHSSTPLPSYLEETVFANAKYSLVKPDEKDLKAFDLYLERYKVCLAIEKAAVETLR